MEITDEILAAYVDGTLPEEQLPEVRSYLSTHPDELEQVFQLMDCSLGDYETDDTVLAKVTDSVSMLNFSAAAFSALPVTVPTITHKRPKVNILQSLRELLDEIKQ
ncbi:MAG: hypothetical protein IKO26_00100 [Paludibacteraceae bacterium]|nr:hypothetical protein [Paludibacteraceae bacterium]